MQRCLACGAELTPGLEWCGRCLAPRNTAHPAYRGPGSYDGGADGPRTTAPRREPVEVEYSRVRGGPTSMGVVGRTLTSIAAFLIAFFVYVYAFPVALGATGGPFFILFGVPALPVMFVVLRRIWRRQDNVVTPRDVAAEA